MITLEQQLKKLDEAIQNCADEDSDEYRQLVAKRKSVSADISSCNYYIRGAKEHIAEKEYELRRLKRESEEGLMNRSSSKASQEKREYAKYLISDIIPWFERDILSSQAEIHKRNLVLSGVPWPEAIQEANRMKEGVKEEKEEELTLF